MSPRPLFRRHGDRFFDMFVAGQDDRPHSLLAREIPEGGFVHEVDLDQVIARRFTHTAAQENGGVVLLDHCRRNCDGAGVLSHERHDCASLEVLVAEENVYVGNLLPHVFQQVAQNLVPLNQFDPRPAAGSDEETGDDRVFREARRNDHRRRGDEAGRFGAEQFPDSRVPRHGQGKRFFARPDSLDRCLGPGGDA